MSADLMAIRAKVPGQKSSSNPTIIGYLFKYCALAKVIQPLISKVSLTLYISPHGD